MDGQEQLESEILHLYQEPVINSSYANTYGEENLVNLVKKYRSLEPEGMAFMKELVVSFSQSDDLTSSYVSVAVLHALGMNDDVQKAYTWAGSRDDAHMFVSHFDIGKSLADHFTPRPK